MLRGLVSGATSSSIEAWLDFHGRLSPACAVESVTDSQLYLRPLIPPNDVSPRINRLGFVPN